MEVTRWQKRTLRGKYKERQREGVPFPLPPEGDASEGLGFGTPTTQQPECLQKELTACHIVQRDRLSVSVASGNI